MNEMHFKNKNEEKKIKGKGFYIALGICIIAIGTAAWTTYNSVTEFINPSKNESLSSKSEKIKNDALKLEQETNNTLSGITNENSVSSQTQQTNTSNVENSELEENNKDTLIVYPVSKNIIKPFSDVNPIYSKTFDDWRVHNACDFSAEKGSTVRAITSGKVLDVKSDPILGNMVLVEHDNQITAYYCGLANTDSVKKDQTISAGDELGTLGDIPGEIKDESHLHFAVKKGDKWIDPMDILKEAKAD